MGITPTIGIIATAIKSPVTIIVTAITARMSLPNIITAAITVRTASMCMMEKDITANNSPIIATTATAIIMATPGMMASMGRTSSPTTADMKAVATAAITMPSAAASMGTATAIITSSRAAAKAAVIVDHMMAITSSRISDSTRANLAIASKPIIKAVATVTAHTLRGPGMPGGPAGQHAGHRPPPPEGGRVAELERKLDHLFRLVSELRQEVKKP